MSSPFSSLKCFICCISYDMEIHIPKSLSCCGRTFCRKCVETTLKNKPECPWCKAEIIPGRNSHNTNFQLLDFVIEDCKWEKCPTHNDEHMKLFCPQDKRKLCWRCEKTSECKNHDLIILSDWESTSEKRLGELKGGLSWTDEKLEEANKIISQNRVTLPNLISKSFEKVRYELQKAEAKTLMKMNSVLNHQQTKISIAVGQDSSLRSEVQTKIQNHLNIFKTEDPLSVLTEDLTMLKSRMESLVGRGQDVVNFEQQLSKMAPLVQKCLDNFFSELNQDFDQEIIDAPVMQTELGDMGNISLQVSGLSVKYMADGSQRKALYFVSNTDQTRKSIQLNYQRVTESQAVLIELRGIEWNEWNLSALGYVLAFQKVSDFYFVETKQPRSQELGKMAHLFSIVFNKPQDIKILNFVEFFDENLFVLINGLIHKCSSLKLLRIKSAQNVSQRSLNDFADNLLLLAPNLKDLNLDVAGSCFPVSMLGRLSLSMLKIKSFTLIVSNIGDFNDLLFSEIVQNISDFMPEIVFLEINVSQTSVTPSCVQALEEKINHIKTWKILNDIQDNQPPLQNMAPGPDNIEGRH